jgi:hypothetical protein
MDCPLLDSPLNDSPLAHSPFWKDQNPQKQKKAFLRLWRKLCLEKCANIGKQN